LAKKAKTEVELIREEMGLWEGTRPPEKNTGGIDEKRKTRVWKQGKRKKAQHRLPEDEESEELPCWEGTLI